MNKHTPGPWQAHRHESTDTYTIHVAGRCWETWAVAHVGDCTQDEANARLIAASPELLEALNSLTAMAEAFPTELHEKHPDVVAARAVIAKATGESK